MPDCSFCSRRLNTDLVIEPMSAEHIALMVMRDGTGSAIMVLHNNNAAGMVNIKYCPICGEQLSPIKEDVK